MNEIINIQDLTITLTDDAKRRITENTVLNFTPTQVYFLLRKYMLRQLGVQEGWYANPTHTKWLEDDGYGHYEIKVVRGDITPEQREVLECLGTVYDLLRKEKNSSPSAGSENV